MPNKPRDSSLQGIPQLAPSLILAVVVYLALDYADDFIGVPLRECSSWLSSLILNSVGFSVTRTGTILATEHFTFDVIPACSGSTTLRVLTAVGMIVCGMHAGLSWPRRLLAMFLVVPIALLANGIRVAALVYLGNLFLKPVEGFLHAFIGVMTFTFAMGSTFLLVHWFATRSSSSVGSPRLKSLLFFVLFFLACLPVFQWIQGSWSTSPQDLHSAPFFLIGIVLFIFIWIKHPPNADYQRSGWFVFCLAQVLFLLALLADINFIKAAVFLAALWALILAVRGLHTAQCSIPVIGLMMLGLPTTTYQMTTLLSKFLPWASTALTLGLKIAAAVPMLVLFWYWHRRKQDAASQNPAPVFWNRWSLTVACVLFLQFLLYNRGSTESNQSHVRLSYLQGEWVGSDSPINDATIAVLGKERILSRAYRKGQQSLDLIVTWSGGDRHAVHPPEYCMTGAGWTIQNQERTTLKVDTHSVGSTKLLLEHHGRQLPFYYWFSDGKQTYPSYKAMLTEDTFRRLRGIRSNWFLFRVIPANNTVDVPDFLSTFKPIIVQPAAG